MSDDFIAWLYDKAQDGVCFNNYWNSCDECPFYDRQNRLIVCENMLIDQKREILMKIYESEVDTK
jgi:hypothetical protein